MSMHRIFEVVFHKPQVALMVKHLQGIWEILSLNNPRKPGILKAAPHSPSNDKLSIERTGEVSEIA